MVNNLINQEHRAKMESLEAAILSDLESVDCKVEHLFAHGTYTRILHIPKGVVITGAIHRYSGINIISKGHLKVITDDGEYEIEAPDALVTGAFVKKAIYAIEDSVWINVLPWDGPEDVDLIEEKMLVPSYEALELEIG